MCVYEAIHVCVYLCVMMRLYIVSDTAGPLLMQSTIFFPSKLVGGPFPFTLAQLFLPFFKLSSNFFVTQNQTKSSQK